MNDFRFTLISVLIFIIIVGLGVLAFFALEPGDRNGARQMINDLEQQLTEKDAELQVALRKIAEYETETVSVDDQEQTDDNEEEDTLDTETADPELLAALERLQDRGVIIGPGNQGADVGTIQKFLNAYEGKSGGLDNDFGPGTRSRVEAFQRAEGLSVDGGVGPGTLGKMIEWLQEN